MRRLTTLLALIAAGLLAMSGVALADAQVTIGDDGFDPKRVHVDVRESIVWTNASDADVSLVGKDPAWESGVIAPGATFSIKITEEGTYEYASVDGSLQGEIVVGQATGGGEGDDPEPNDVKKDNEGGEGKSDGTGGGSRGGNGGGTEGDADPLPETGVDLTVPGGLSVLLIALGAGLLLVTRPTPVERAL